MGKKGNLPSSSNDHTSLIINQLFADCVVRRVLQKVAQEIWSRIANLILSERFQRTTLNEQTFFLLTTSFAAHLLNSPMGPWYVKASMMVSK